MSDIMKLRSLRMSVALLAKDMRVQTEQLPVLDTCDQELFRLVQEVEIGWCDLCEKMNQRFELIRSSVDLKEVLGEEY